MDVYVYAYDRTTVWRNFLFVRMNSMAMEIANCKKKEQEAKTNKNCIVVYIFEEEKIHSSHEKTMCRNYGWSVEHRDISSLKFSAHKGIGWVKSPWPIYVPAISSELCIHNLANIVNNHNNAGFLSSGVDLILSESFGQLPYPTPTFRCFLSTFLQIE